MNVHELMCKKFLKLVADGCVLTGDDEQFTNPKSLVGANKNEIMNHIQSGFLGKKLPGFDSWIADDKTRSVIANKFRKSKTILVSKPLSDFAPATKAEVDELFQKYSSRPLDLPFTHCFVESLQNGNPLDSLSGGTVPLEDAGMNLCGFLISEDEDLNYDVSAVCTPMNKFLDMGGVPVIVNGRKFPMVIAIMGKIIEHINDTKNVVMGVEKVSIRSKGRVGRNFIRHQINQVIHIQPKKQKAARGLGREIDWSHRWEVRGHWRKIAGLGKNRLGEYCVKGMTWVKAHTKGPEDKDVVPKTRVVQS